MPKSKAAAVVTIFAAPKMTAKGRKNIAAWLRKQAVFLDRNHKQMSDGRYTARFLY